MEHSNQKIEQNHVGVYGVVFDTLKKHVLLILKARGPYKDMYDLPGGTIEEGETKEETLLREFEEEIGCTVSSYDFLYQDLYEFDYISKTRGNIWFKHTAYFYNVVLPENGEIKNVPDGHDSLGATYVSVESIQNGEISVAPMAKKVIESLL